MQKNILKLLVILFLLPIVALSQNTASGGMKFEHLAPKELFAKAKKENKFIFLDFYLTTCLPCKYMVEHIFSRADVGSFFNPDFVSAKVQLDSTEKDNDYVKSWLKEGNELATKYHISHLPVYLILNPDGEVVHRLHGAMSAERLITIGKSALNSNDQYYTQMKKYDAGERSPKFLLNLIKIAKSIDEEEVVEKISKTYLSTQNNLFTKDNLEVLFNLRSTSKDTAFKIALNEGAKADKILGNPGKSAELVTERIVFERSATPFNDDHLDINNFVEQLKEEFPQYATSISNRAKAEYYMQKKQWDLFIKAGNEVFKERNANSLEFINRMAEVALDQIADPKLLESSINWIKFSVDKNPDIKSKEIYARLLYKTGKKKEAIALQQKIVKEASMLGDFLPYYEERLAKMKKMS